MSHILIAIASPTAPGGLLEPVADLARRLGSRVTLLHMLTAGGGHPTAMVARTQQSVDELVQHFADAGVECQTIGVRTDEDTAGAILEAANEVQATLIAMGMRGKSSFIRRTGGDVPMQLLSRTTLPVLLLPPGDHRSPL